MYRSRHCCGPAGSGGHGKVKMCRGADNSHEDRLSIAAEGRIGL